MDEFYCVFTFHVTQHALMFEDLMVKNKIAVKLMPAPRQVSSSCGTAAVVPCELEEKIKGLCLEENIQIEDFHKVVEKKNSSWFSKLINK